MSKKNIQDGQQAGQPDQPTPTLDIANLEQQVAELTTALQRERADAENMRRRHADQLSQLQTDARIEVVRSLLPVVDNVERALAHVPSELKDNDYVKGVAGVAKQFTSVLDKLGVTRIPTTGQPFDPHLHEAVSTEEGEGPSDEIIDELQAGYTMGERVVRHAMVRVRA